MFGKCSVSARGFFDLDRGHVKLSKEMIGKCGPLAPVSVREAPPRGMGESRMIMLCCRRCLRPKLGLNAFGRAQKSAKTCQLREANPFLTELEAHTIELVANPASWMPANKTAVSCSRILGKVTNFARSIRYYIGTAPDFAAYVHKLLDLLLLTASRVPTAHAAGPEAAQVIQRSQSRLAAGPPSPEKQQHVVS